MQQEQMTKNFDALVAENRFINDLLVEIERVLADKGWSQADLARALSITEARVSQIMSGNGKNLQARTIARIAHFLDVRASITFVDEIACVGSDYLQRSPAMTVRIREWLAVAKESRAPEWNGPSNDDEAVGHEFDRREREAA